MSTLRFETFSFPRAYEVTLEPESPGNGEWGARCFCFGRAGRHIEEFEFESRWGTPLIARMTPRSSAEWVGMFAAGGLGVVRGVYACPSPTDVCVIVDGLAFHLNVSSPEVPATIACDAVVAAVPVDDALLLLATDTDLVAIGRGGVAWKAPHLVRDSLRVLRANREVVVVSGDVGDRMATITLTSATGAVWGSDYR